MLSVFTIANRFRNLPLACYPVIDAKECVNINILLVHIWVAETVCALSPFIQNFDSVFFAGCNGTSYASAKFVFFIEMWFIFHHAYMSFCVFVKLILFIILHFNDMYIYNIYFACLKNILLYIYIYIYITICFSSMRNKCCIYISWVDNCSCSLMISW